jgi:hypothetical protein
MFPTLPRIYSNFSFNLKESLAKFIGILDWELTKDERFKEMVQMVFVLDKVARQIIAKSKL